MKRILTAYVAIIMVYNVNSQTVFEGVKISQHDIVGSARYMGIAGAFGALGGDVSAIKDNPAGLGIFRKSELTTTVDVQMQSSKALWDKVKTSDGNYSTAMNNLSLVLVGKTWRAESGYAGLVNSNFSFSYNKLKNFNRNIRIKNENVAQTMTDYFAFMSHKIKPQDYLFDDEYISDNQLNNLYGDERFSWLGIMSSYGKLIEPFYKNSELERWNSVLDANLKINPDYTLFETGGINEYSFGWSGNFSNRLFLGATINIQSINYESNSVYKEGYSNGEIKLNNSLLYSGSGLNVNVGAIAVPVDFIRIGFSVHTPMFYNIDQLNYASLEYNTINKDNVKTNGDVLTPKDNYVNYQFQTPLQLNISTAFILDKKGFISAEYVYNNYKGMKFIPNDDHDFYFENDDIKNMIQNARTIKIGGEYRATNNISMRAGYANTSSITNSKANKILFDNSVRTDPEFFKHNSTNYATFGVGYRENTWYFDIAYINRLFDEDYYAYNSDGINLAYQVKPANVKTSNNNVLVTFGIKF